MPDVILMSFLPIYERASLGNCRHVKDYDRTSTSLDNGKHGKADFERPVN